MENKRIERPQGLEISSEAMNAMNAMTSPLLSSMTRTRREFSEERWNLRGGVKINDAVLDDYFDNKFIPPDVRKFPKETMLVRAHIPNMINESSVVGSESEDEDEFSSECVWKPKTNGASIQLFLEKCRSVMCLPGLIVSISIHRRCATYGCVLGRAPEGDGIVVFDGTKHIVVSPCSCSSGIADDVFISCYEQYRVDEDATRLPRAIKSVQEMARNLLRKQWREDEVLDYIKLRRRYKEDLWSIHSKSVLGTTRPMKEFLRMHEFFVPLTVIDSEELWRANEFKHIIRRATLILPSTSTRSSAIRSLAVPALPNVMSCGYPVLCTEDSDDDSGDDEGEESRNNNAKQRGCGCGTLTASSSSSSDLCEPEQEPICEFTCEIWDERVGRIMKTEAPITRRQTKEQEEAINTEIGRPKRELRPSMKVAENASTNIDDTPSRKISGLSAKSETMKNAEVPHASDRKKVSKVPSGMATKKIVAMTKVTTNVSIKSERKNPSTIQGKTATRKDAGDHTTRVAKSIGPDRKEKVKKSTAATDKPKTKLSDQGMEQIHRRVVDAKRIAARELKSSLSATKRLVGGKQPDREAEKSSFFSSASIRATSSSSPNFPAQQAFKSAPMFNRSPGLMAFSSSNSVIKASPSVPLLDQQTSQLSSSRSAAAVVTHSQVIPVLPVVPPPPVIPAAPYLPSFPHENPTSSNIPTSPVITTPPIIPASSIIPVAPYLPSFAGSDSSQVIAGVARPVEQLHPVTNEVLRLYRSGKEAAIFMNIAQGGISLCCSGNKADCAGFKWRFYEGLPIDWVALEGTQRPYEELQQMLSSRARAKAELRKRKRDERSSSVDNDEGVMDDQPDESDVKKDEDDEEEEEEEEGEPVVPTSQTSTWHNYVADSINSFCGATSLFSGFVGISVAAAVSLSSSGSSSSSSSSDSSSSSSVGCDGDEGAEGLAEKRRKTTGMAMPPNNILSNHGRFDSDSSAVDGDGSIESRNFVRISSIEANEEKTL